MKVTRIERKDKKKSLTAAAGCCCCCCWGHSGGHEGVDPSTQAPATGVS